MSKTPDSLRNLVSKSGILNTLTGASQGFGAGNIQLMAAAAGVSPEALPAISGLVGKAVDLVSEKHGPGAFFRGTKNPGQSLDGALAMPSQHANEFSEVSRDASQENARVMGI